MTAKSNTAVADPGAAPKSVAIPIAPSKTTPKTYIPITATTHRFRDNHDECCTLLKKSTANKQSNPAVAAPAAARKSTPKAVPKKTFQVAYYLKSTSREAARKFTAKVTTSLTKIFHKYKHNTITSTNPADKEVIMFVTTKKQFDRSTAAQYYPPLPVN